ARDTRLPAVSVHKRFKGLVEDELAGLCEPGALKLVADPSGRVTVSAAVEAHRERENRRVILAVGPEGGWNSYELALLDAHGFECVGMGRRTLRTDTACVSLLAIAHAALAV